MYRPGSSALPLGQSVLIGIWHMLNSDWHTPSQHPCFGSSLLIGIHLFMEWPGGREVHSQLPHSWTIQKQQKRKIIKINNNQKSNNWSYHEVDWNMKQSDLSEKTVALLDLNPSTPIVIIPKSRFVESSKGNTKFLDEVIHQKIVVKILPEVMFKFQGGMISIFFLF